MLHRFQRQAVQESEYPRTPLFLTQVLDCRHFGLSPQLPFFSSFPSKLSPENLLNCPPPLSDFPSAMALLHLLYLPRYPETPYWGSATSLVAPWNLWPPWASKSRLPCFARLSNESWLQMERMLPRLVQVIPELQVTWCCFKTP